MIPGFSAVAALAYLAVGIAMAATPDPRRRSNLATADVVIACAILLNALGNLADEWLTVLVWCVGLPVAVWAARLHRRRAAELARKHEEVR